MFRAAGRNRKAIWRHPLTIALLGIDGIHKMTESRSVLRGFPIRAQLHLLDIEIMKQLNVGLHLQQLQSCPVALQYQRGVNLCGA